VEARGREKKMLCRSDLIKRIHCLNGDSGGSGRGRAGLGGPLEQGPRGRVEPGPEVGAGGDGRVVGGPAPGQAAVGPGLGREGVGVEVGLEPVPEQDQGLGPELGDARLGDAELAGDLQHRPLLVEVAMTTARSRSGRASTASAR